MRPLSLSDAARMVREAGRVTIGSGGLDLTGIAGPVEVNPENLSAAFLAGTSIASLQETLAPHGLWWPVDAAPDRTLGAVLATAGPFPGRTGYGRVADWVLGMDVILAGGKQMRLGGQTMKNVAGYDLSSLMVGSRGTLGVIGAATLRLLPRPERQMTVILPRERAEAARDLCAACEWDGERLLVRFDGRQPQVQRRMDAAGGTPVSPEAWDAWYERSPGRYVRRPDWSAVGAPLLGLWRTGEPVRYSPLERKMRDAIAPGCCFNPDL